MEMIGIYTGHEPGPKRIGVKCIILGSNRVDPTKILKNQEYCYYCCFCCCSNKQKIMCSHLMLGSTFIEEKWMKYFKIERSF